MSLTAPAAKELSHALASASDTALGRVVGMLETMAGAESAEQLLAGVRFRLRELRPPRPLRMTRLLFLPVDGAIIEPQFWQRNSGRVPRSVLKALGDQLHDASGDEWAKLAAAAQGRAMDDAEAVGAIGRRLWALAVKTMPQTPPPGWTAATGLKPEDHAPLARLCLGVWRHASPLWDAVEAAGGPLPEPLLRAALAPCAADELVFSACLATLMEHAQQPWAVATGAGGLGATPRLVAERALDDFIERAAPVIDAEQPGLSACRAAHFAHVLAELERGAASTRSERRRRLQQLRLESDQACRAAHATALKTQMIKPLARREEPADDAEVARLESAAREIRRLGAAGRRLGGGSHYDDAERGMVERIAGLTGGAPPASITTMDYARLVEIISGPDAALRLLG